MFGRSRKTVVWVCAAFALGVSCVGFFGFGRALRTERHGIEPRGGFAMAEADRRKSRAYLNFMYGFLYQERGQRDEAAVRFAEACALDRVLQPSFEPDANPS